MSTGQQEKTAPDIGLLDVPAGLMIQAQYGPREYHQGCGEQYLGFHPAAQRREISLWEILESWREYRCALCNKKLWNVEDHR